LPSGLANGIDLFRPDLSERVFAGHSLRAGFLTSAAKRGASTPNAMLPLTT
jgi:hypothetical protein